MKKQLAFLSSLLLICFILSNNVEARSSVSDYKNPDINLATIEKIIIEPIVYAPEIVLDDYTKLRVEAAFREQFHGEPLSFVWSTDTTADLRVTHNTAYLVIYLKDFSWDNYRTEGHYESYSVSKPSYIIDDYYWTRSGNRRYWRGGDRTVSRTYYIEPEERFQARAEVQLTLSSPDKKIVYWIYNQERFDTKSSSPDRSLKTIAKEAKQTFDKTYKKEAVLLLKS